MTHTQASLLKAIHHAITTTGVSPSYEELCAAIGTNSRGHVHKVVAGLMQQGYLRRGVGKRHRALEIVRLPASFGGVCPACGRGPDA